MQTDSWVCKLFLPSDPEIHFFTRWTRSRFLIFKDPLSFTLIPLRPLHHKSSILHFPLPQLTTKPHLSGWVTLIHQNTTLLIEQQNKLSLLQKNALITPVHLLQTAKIITFLHHPIMDCILGELTPNELFRTKQVCIPWTSCIRTSKREKIMLTCLRPIISHLILTF